jgi:hypothetical protein
MIFLRLNPIKLLQNEFRFYYEDLEPLIELTRKGEQNVFWNTPIKWFAKSSGTTNAKSKFIPVSTEALRGLSLQRSKDLLCLYLNNNENSELFLGKSLRLGGSSSKLYETTILFLEIYPQF